MAHNVSNEYKQVIYSGDARNKLKILFNNVEFQDADRYCERLTIKSRILPNGAKRFSLNNFISKEAELILHDIDTSIIKDQISISIGTLVGNSYEYVPIGIFNIQDTPTNDKNKTTIKLRDNSVKFDFNYNAKPLIDAGDGTATKLQILQDICSKAGVTCNISSFIGSTDRVGIYDNTITARQYIADLAEQAGRIATINRSGELIFVNINSLTTWNIPLSIVEKYELGKAYKIGKVVYEDGVRKYETASTTYDTLFLDASNPYVSSQAQVNSILQQVNSFEIDSVKTGKILGNPAIDGYDLINIYNDKVENNPSIFKTLATNDLVYTGVLINTFDTQIGEDDREQNVSITGEATFKKWAKTEIDNINGEVLIQAGKITTLEDSIDIYSVDLDIYNITIPIGTDKKPLETKTYQIGYYAYYKGQQVTPTVTPLTTASGITQNVANNKINLSVSTNTIIANLTNELSYRFNYVVEEETYTSTLKIMVVLAQKGEQGIQGQAGQDGKSSYLHIKYSEDGTTFTPAQEGYPIGEKPSRWQGTYVDFNATDSTTFSDYNWVDTAIMVEDLLTPTSNVSGTSIMVNDSADADLLYFELEGKTTQDGEPTPDSPSDLVSVGYENLYEGSQDFSGTWNSENAWETDSQTYNGLVVKKRAGSWNGISKDINVINGETYTFSVYIKCDEARQVTIYTNGGTSGISLSKTIDATTDWERYSFTFTATANGTVRLRVENRTNSTTNYTYICGYQLEKSKEVRGYIPYGKYGIEVKTTGKNLLNNTATSQTINGLNIVVNNDKTVSISGTATATTDLTIVTSMILKAGTYTLSGTPSTGGSSTYKMQLLRAGSTLNEQGNGLTFTTTEDYNNVGLIIKVYSGQTLNNITFKPQLEKGTQKTTYEPYKLNTYLYTLDQPLRSIGDTKDLLYIKNGMLYVDRKIGIVVLDGSEIDFYDTKYYYIPLNSITPKPKANGPLLSNYFVNAYGDVNGGISTGAGAIAFSRNSMPSDITTFSQFKAWLSTHNVEVQYILVEPYTEELGSVEIPSTYKGITHINTTDGLEPNMNIIYVKDLPLTNYVESHYAELKIKEDGIETRVESIENNGYGDRITAVETAQTSTDLKVNVISTNSGIELDYDSQGKPISGKVREVTTTTGFTFNAEGMTIEDTSSNFKAQHRNTGTYYKEGDTIVGQYTKDGSKQKDLELFGVYYYGKNDFPDTPMFVAQLYTDGNGEECVGHFWNLGD